MDPFPSWSKRLKAANTLSAMGSRSARIWISAYRRYDAGARSVTTSPSSQQWFPKSQFGGWHDTGVFHSLHPAGRKGFGIVLHFETKNHPETDAKPITSHLNTKKSRNKSTYWDPKNLPPTPAPAMWCFFSLTHSPSPWGHRGSSRSFEDPGSKPQPRPCWVKTKLWSVFSPVLPSKNCI